MKHYIRVYVNEAHTHGKQGPYPDGPYPFHTSEGCPGVKGAVLVEKVLNLAKPQRKWRPCTKCCKP